MEQTINMIMITNKFEKSNFKYAEENFIEIFIKNNSKYFSLDKIYTESNNTSKLFQKYPILYVNGSLFDDKNIILFIISFFINNNTDEYNQIKELIDYIYDELRNIYKSFFILEDKFFIKSDEENKNKILGIKLKLLEYFKKINDNKDLVYIIIYNFISEYNIINNYLKSKNKSELPNIDIILDYNLDIDNIIKIKIDSQDIFKKINEVDNTLPIKLNIKENDEKDIEDYESEQSWKCNLMSLSLFFGVTSLMYLLSLYKRR